MCKGLSTYDYIVNERARQERESKEKSTTTLDELERGSVQKSKSSNRVLPQTDMTEYEMRDSGKPTSR